MTGSGIFPKVDGDVLYAYDVNNMNGIHGKTFRNYSQLLFNAVRIGTNGNLNLARGLSVDAIPNIKYDINLQNTSGTSTYASGTYIAFKSEINSGTLYGSDHTTGSTTVTSVCLSINDRNLKSYSNNILNNNFNTGSANWTFVTAGATSTTMAGSPHTRFGTGSALDVTVTNTGASTTITQTGIDLTNVDTVGAWVGATSSDGRINTNLSINGSQIFSTSVDVFNFLTGTIPQAYRTINGSISIQMQNTGWTSSQHIYLDSVNIWNSTQEDTKTYSISANGSTYESITPNVFKQMSQAGSVLKLKIDYSQSSGTFMGDSSNAISEYALLYNLW